MKQVIKYIGLTICALFAILGFIGTMAGINEALLLLVIGIVIPAVYYGFVKEGSAGDNLMGKMLASNTGRLILGALVFIFLIGRIILSSIRN